MSGHKRATIALRQAEASRFAQAGRQLELVEQDYQDIRQKIQHIQQDQLRTSFESLQMRQEQFDFSLNQLGGELRKVESGIAHSIIGQAQELQRQVENVGLNLWDQTNQLMESQSIAFQRLLDQAYAQQQAEFMHMQTELDSIKQRQEYKRRVALKAFQNAQEFYGSLEDTYPVERFIPGLASAVSNELLTTQQNIAAGFYEAGLVSAQQVYSRASAARLEIESYLFQHSLALNSTLSKGIQVLSTYDSQASVHAIDLEGNLLNQIVDVDYWSWGAWREWRRKCSRLTQRLQHRPDQLAIDEIDTIFQQILECEEALPDIVCKARENILASQIRFNLAECIVDSLQEQGFFIDNSQYEHSDQRQPYLTCVKNLEGSRVTIRLSPQIDNPKLHTIDLVSEDQEIRTEHELHQRAKTLRESLKAYGLQVHFTPVTDLEPAQANGILTTGRLKAPVSKEQARLHNPTGRTQPRI